MAARGPPASAAMRADSLVLRRVVARVHRNMEVDAPLAPAREASGERLREIVDAGDVLRSRARAPGEPRLDIGAEQRGQGLTPPPRIRARSTPAPSRPGRGRRRGVQRAVDPRTGPRGGRRPGRFSIHSARPARKSAAWATVSTRTSRLRLEGQPDAPARLGLEPLGLLRDRLGAPGRRRPRPRPSLRASRAAGRDAPPARRPAAAGRAVARGRACTRCAPRPPTTGRRRASPRARGRCRGTVQRHDLEPEAPQPPARRTAAAVSASAGAATHRPTPSTGTRRSRTRAA